MEGPPRLDLRHNAEKRPFTVEFGIAPEANGSVKVTQGKSSVFVSVYGPAQPRYSRHEEFNKCSVDIEYKAGFSGSTSNRNQIENDGAMFLRQIVEPALMLEQFPRMLISIKVSVLNDDGSLFALSLNACTLALAISGLPMLYMPVSAFQFFPV